LISKIIATPVIECEATTLLIAVKVAADKGFERVAYESDNQSVVHVVLSGCICEEDFLLRFG